MTELYTDRHLGGYVIGGDPATWYPDLWTWLVNELGVRTVLDVGCGEGHAIDFFVGLGCSAFGIDGVAQPHDSIIPHDYTQGAYELGGDFDLVWCCEFVEHIDEVCVENFLETFKSGRTVLMTHAEPGQAGFHHVNCRTSEYWKAQLDGAGFDYDPLLTIATRRQAAKNPHEANYFLRSGMAFVRR